MRYFYNVAASERKKARKAAIYSFICDRIEKEGYPPTLDEVLEEVDIKRNMLREYLTEINGNTVFRYEDGRIRSYADWRRKEMVMKHPFLSLMYYNYNEKFQKVCGKAERIAGTASGNEMAGAGIHDGDWLIFDMFREPLDGEQAYIWLNGGRCLRTVHYREDGSVYLVMETPEPEITEVKDTDAFEVIGVLWKVIPKEESA